MRLDNDDRKAAIKSVKEAMDYIEQGYPGSAQLQLQYALNSLRLPEDNYRSNDCCCQPSCGRKQCKNPVYW